MNLTLQSETIILTETVKTENSLWTEAASDFYTIILYSAYQCLSHYK